MTRVTPVVKFACLAVWTKEFLSKDTTAWKELTMKNTVAVILPAV
jgi:hypothetical protein